MKTFQGCFSGIPGSGRQNGDLLLDAFNFLCSCNKQRKNRKRDILESRSGTMVELKGIAFTDFCQGCDFIRRKLTGVDGCNVVYLPAESRKKMGKDFLCHPGVGKLKGSGNVKRTGRNIRIDKQTAVWCNTLENSSRI